MWWSSEPARPDLRPPPRSAGMASTRPSSSAATSVATRWRARYDGLRLNTWRAFSRLPGTPLPRSAGRYASRDAFISYLEGYTRDNGLRVRHGIEVQRVDRRPDGGWLVQCAEGPLAARRVVVATGWDAEPHLPAWAQQSTFGGELAHIAAVKDLARFAGKQVLVVGAGNSGIDLAGLLVRSGAGVTVSMRTPPNIFPRDLLQIPLGPITLVAEQLPSLPSDLIGRIVQKQLYGDLRPYGMPPAPQGFLTRFRNGVNPAVDDGFVAALKTGRAQVVGEVARLTRDGPILATGELLPSDVVILATGYRRGLEPIVGHLGALTDSGAPRFDRGAPGDPANPGLYFAGFQVALSGQIRMAAIHARRIGRAIARDGQDLVRRSTAS